MRDGRVSSLVSAKQRGLRENTKQSNKPAPVAQEAAIGLHSLLADLLVLEEALVLLELIGEH